MGGKRREKYSGAETHGQRKRHFALGANSGCFMLVRPLLMQEKQRSRKIQFAGHETIPNPPPQEQKKIGDKPKSPQARPGIFDAQMPTPGDNQPASASRIKANTNHGDQGEGEEHEPEKPAPANVGVGSGTIATESCPLTERQSVTRADHGRLGLSGSGRKFENWGLARPIQVKSGLGFFGIEFQVRLVPRGEFLVSSKAER